MPKTKTKEEKFLSWIKKMYQNYGIDVTAMEEEEFKRLLDFYVANPAKLIADLKKSSIHANDFSDVDIL